MAKHRMPTKARHNAPGRAVVVVMIRPGEKSDSDFWAFLLEKIRKSEENQNKNQLTNTSINLGVMGISTLVLHSTYVYQ